MAKRTQQIQRGKRRRCPQQWRPRMFTQERSRQRHFVPKQLRTRIPHPTDASRQLFLAFDQGHIIKNVRSQFLSNEMCGNKEISSVYLKDLYKMQQGSTMKPVCFLTRKHIFPTNIEKMGVRTAIQVLSPPVTAALHFMKDQAGHTCDLKFANEGPTVEIMSNMYR
ncbi:hypothetical protein HPB51_029567 [Rhipicephalus microplus]|uniref:Transposable element P transposase-like GTP-binding insertion domain-containing protein n=1 Tax=Rhipicephalus microplus TaxID=6941 RepID=A0A9J6CUP1_RHIMP|nr:hypothetical protein HPB51_029567 [Rhipicephalus microplus]